MGYGNSKCIGAVSLRVWYGVRATTLNRSIFRRIKTIISEYIKIIITLIKSCKSYCITSLLSSYPLVLELGAVFCPYFIYTVKSERVSESTPLIILQITVAFPPVPALVQEQMYVIKKPIKIVKRNFVFILWIKSRIKSNQN